MGNQGTGTALLAQRRVKEFAIVTLTAIAFTLFFLLNSALFGLLVGAAVTALVSVIVLLIAALLSRDQRSISA